ncbi:MAG TPA: ABC transporter ATP-binding protein [Stellaceae bacterium]|nr:ABC transporter ATP-binding protein [Stellaceae bacterium]
MLEATGIEVRRGDKRLLTEVSLTVRPGEVVGIVGPNGAGKSTLLRVLAGLERPARGRVALDGAELARLDRWDRAKRIAYLPQGGTAESAVSVRQVVSLGRLPHRERAGPADHAAVNRALAAVDMEGFADRVVTTLSGGERARALFARAMAVEADYLIADEPTLALDPGHQLDLLDQLRSLADAGSGVAVILHDLTHALRTCDRLLLLSRGRVAAAGTPTETLTPAALAAVYGIEAVYGSHDGMGFVVPWRAGPRGR